jgi:hypothetical protein
MAACETARWPHVGPAVRVQVRLMASTQRYVTVWTVALDRYRRNVSAGVALRPQLRRPPSRAELAGTFGGRGRGRSPEAVKRGFRSQGRPTGVYLRPGRGRSSSTEPRQAEPRALNRTPTGPVRNEIMEETSLQVFPLTVCQQRLRDGLFGLLSLDIWSQLHF